MTKEFERYMDNYLDLTLLEAYDVITSDTDPWPNTFQAKKKVKFIQQLMDYFQEREEYERCAKLLKIQKEVIDYELENRKPPNRRSRNITNGSSEDISS
tara:strand:- start:1481 stop:1777 length:297 start_codon:yes stop_codon:yes gene_type:complete